jgi:hypothetical protein
MLLDNVTNKFSWSIIIMGMHKCSNKLRIIIKAQDPYKAK